MKIGDTVIMNQSRYSKRDYVLVQIVGETKNYWRLPEGDLASKKDGIVKGSGGVWKRSICEYLDQAKKAYDLWLLKKTAMNIIDKFRYQIDHLPSEVLKAWIEFNENILFEHGKKESANG